jgi:hypothetical protein
MAFADPDPFTPLLFDSDKSRCRELIAIFAAGLLRSVVAPPPENPSESAPDPLEPVPVILLSDRPG